MPHRLFYHEHWMIDPLAEPRLRVGRFIKFCKTDKRARHGKGVLCGPAGATPWFLFRNNPITKAR